MTDQALAQKIINAFEPNGLLSKSIEGFEPREQQREMVASIIEAFDQSKDLVVEAGTGTGKTFAYLVPNMLTHKKMIISTGTKNLQDQLMERDVPIIKSIFCNKDYSIFCLKGRANYLCKLKQNKIAEAIDRGSSPYPSIPHDELNDLYVKVENFLRQEPSGDLSKFSDVSNLGINKFRANSMSCAGDKCPFVDHCYFKLAREQAKTADLVIVNHSFFMSSVMVKEDFERDLLPPAEVIVFDEAHKLPEFARHAFSSSISLSDFQKQLDAFEEYIGIYAPHLLPKKQQGSFDFDELHINDKKCRALITILKPLKEHLISFTDYLYRLINGQHNDRHDEKPKLFLRDLADDLNVKNLIENFGENITKDYNKLRELTMQYCEPKMELSGADSNQELKDLVNGFKELKDTFENIMGIFFPLEYKKKFTNKIEPTPKEMVDYDQAQSKTQDKSPEQEFDPNARDQYFATLEMDFHEDPKTEKKKYSFTISNIPIDFSQKFYNLVIKAKQRAIFTSATLMAGGSFANFAMKLGIKPEETIFKAYGSPFDYPRQGCLYIPSIGLASTNDFERVRAQKVVDLALPLLNIIDGGFFILCTSISVMNSVYYLLRPKVSGKRPIFLQTNHAKIDIMRAVQTKRNSIVVATSSFWEGVDVKGKALSCVIIDRLPFANQADLLTKALSDDAIRKGQRPFMVVQLPQMLLAIKQGVGRLIRSCSDYGVVVIADDRLNSNKGYLSTLMNDLPPFKIVRNMDEVKSFWNGVKDQFK